MNSVTMPVDAQDQPCAQSKHCCARDSDHQVAGDHPSRQLAEPAGIGRALDQQRGREAGGDEVQSGCDRPRDVEAGICGRAERRQHQQREQVSGGLAE